MGEHPWGQQGELVPGEVEAEEPREATPAHSSGEVSKGSKVVECPAQVELLKGTARYAESLWMDERQLVSTEVQEAQIDEGREGVGRQLRYPEETTNTLTSSLRRFIILSCLETRQLTSLYYQL